jgi:hypothetical protein
MRRRLPGDLSHLLRRDLSTCGGFRRAEFLISVAVAQGRLGIQAARFLAERVKDIHLATHVDAEHTGDDPG